MTTRLVPLMTTTLAAALALAATAASAGLAPPLHLVAATGKAMENTGRNVRDKAGATATPEDQKESKADVKITAAVRQAVVADKNLSVNAHNVKIITRDGAVTLRGPVESQAESLRLQELAKAARGVVRVDNQLDIKAP